MNKFYTFAALYGDSILVKGWDYDANDYFKDRIEFRPTLYVPTNKPSKYKTIDGINVSPVNPGGIKDCKEFIREYKDIAGITVYGMERFIYQYLAEEYDEEIQFDTSKVKTYCLDIETTSENGFPQPRLAEEEILLITLKNLNTKKVTTFGSRPYTPKEENVEYILCKDEATLLRTFIGWWKRADPDVVTGWNIELFDIPYIMNRIRNVLSEKDVKSLSCWNFYIESEEYSHGKKHQKYNIYGVSILDYMNIYKKFTFTNRESYRLDLIAEIELGEKKLDHSEFDTFKDFYTNGWEKYVDYNIVDVHLVDRLEEKLKLLDLVMLMAYDAHCNFEDTFFQVRLWDIIIYNALRKKNIVVSPINRSDKDEKYAGAYVKEPIPGTYDWVVSYDINSLYPSLIRFLNISPETLITDRAQVSVGGLIDKEVILTPSGDYAIAANGCLYSKEKLGFMPELVRRIYDERVEYKNKMIDCKKEYIKNPSEQLSKEISKWSNFQMARKIQLNSLYGALGNQYFRYFLVDNAESITLTGQVAIRWIERKINEYLNNVLKTKNKDYVIASDTDSVYIHMGPLVRRVFPEFDNNNPEKSVLQNRIVEVLNKFCENKIGKFIDASYDEFSDYLNAYEKCLVMKRECIADRGIWTAKKRYILNVWDEEGVRYKEPKLKMMGIEAVKSSTPAPCREYIKECIRIIMTGTEDDLIEYVDNKRIEFLTLDPSYVAFPRSVTDMDKYDVKQLPFIKNTPYHVKAALLYNILLKEKKLSHKYNIIQNGEKIKFLYLKKQNPYMAETIGFITQYPKEFDLTKYLDYDTIFRKGFIDPLESILTVIGWKTEKTNDLSSYFL
jgi:DNA polymerase elongation subunit (family B)